MAWKAHRSLTPDGESPLHLTFPDAKHLRKHNPGALRALARGRIVVEHSAAAIFTEETYDSSKVAKKAGPLAVVLANPPEPRSVGDLVKGGAKRQLGAFRRGYLPLPAEVDETEAWRILARDSLHETLTKSPIYVPSIPEISRTSGVELADEAAEHGLVVVIQQASDDKMFPGSHLVQPTNHDVHVAEPHTGGHDAIQIQDDYFAGIGAVLSSVL